MDRAVFVALSGAVLQERRLEALTDNLANINTPGFKKVKPVFSNAMPFSGGPRVFSVAKESALDMSQGVLENTGGRLDVALKGSGFFSVNTPIGVRYTRNGGFSIGKDNTLVTSDGSAVLGEKGAIRLSGADVAIDAEGNIRDNGALVDKLKIIDFDNAGLLRREGSYFSAAVPGVRETAAARNTQVEQGYREVSNVNVVQAMTTMIEAMRAYETNSKMIQTLDDMTRKSIDEVGRVA